MTVKLYIIALPLLIAFDMLWLGFIAKDFYKKQIGFLMSQNINWIVVALFYLLFTIGLVFFVIQPSVERESWTYAFFVGALFGLITYATYDFTNLATLKDWPLLVTVVDLVWGTIIGAVVSVLSYFLHIISL